MPYSRYKLSTQFVDNSSTVILKTESEASNKLPDEQLKKLSIIDDQENTTLGEQELCDLIYDTDSDENEYSDSIQNCEDGIEIKDNTISTTSISEKIQKRNSLEGNNKPLSTSEKLKQIAKENELLEKKVLAQKEPKKKIDYGLNKVSSSAAINRKKAQWNIDRNNQILYKKIQGAKPSGLSIRKGVALCRETKLFA